MRQSTRGTRWRDWQACLCLTVLCAALYLPGLTTIPPVDRDEARFAQATKQMLASGDFIRPRFQTDDRFNKPIGIYWLQAAAVSLTQQQGHGAIWAYRLPSVLGAYAAVLLTYGVGCRLFNRSVALLGAALLASSALLVIEAHLAATDAALLACVVAAQACLASLYTAAHRGRPAVVRYAAGFWFAQGVGILLKGPIVPLVSGLTIAALLLVDRRTGTRMLRGLRAPWGVPLMLVVILPWMVAVGVATDWAFYAGWIGRDVVPKIVSGQESHGAPPGFYLLIGIATFWPASFALSFGVVRGWRHRNRVAERFCLAWLIPTWLFFEIMPTKLPHYVLPAYPALALLLARALCAPFTNSALASRPTLMRTGFVLWGLVTLTAGVVVIVGAMTLGSGVDFPVASAALAAVSAAILCTWLCWKGQLVRASWIAVVGSVALFAPVLQWVLPNLRALWLSRAAAAAIAEHTNRDHSGRPLAAVGYHEPSLIFLAGAGAELVEPLRAATFLKERSDGLVLVSGDQRDAFLRAAHDLGIPIREVWSADGINYSKGQRTRLVLFEQQPPLQADAGR